VGHQVTVWTGAGTYWFDLEDTTVFAPFEGAWAWADSQVGVPSALGVLPAGYGGGSGADTLVDESNNVHVLSFTAPGGMPPSHIQHFINGALRSDQTILWIGTDGGWVMGESYLEVHAETGGTVSLWTSHNGEIAGAGLPALDALKDVALTPINFLRPAPLAAQHYWDCRSEWATYLLASLALDATIDALIVAPSSATVKFFLAAAAVWGKTLDDLLECFGEHEQ
jgi:hypothetical protein